MFNETELQNQLSDLRRNVLQTIKGSLNDGDEIEIDEIDYFITDCYDNTINLTNILFEDDTIWLSGINNIDHKKGSAGEGTIFASDVLDVHQLFLLLNIINQN